MTIMAILGRQKLISNFFCLSNIPAIIVEIQFSQNMCQLIIWSYDLTFPWQRKFHKKHDYTLKIVSLRAWTNDKCLATKHNQTVFGYQTFYRLDTLLGAV